MAENMKVEQKKVENEIAELQLKLQSTETELKRVRAERGTCGQDSDCSGSSRCISGICEGGSVTNQVHMHVNDYLRA